MKRRSRTELLCYLITVCNLVFFSIYLTSMGNVQRSSVISKNPLRTKEEFIANDVVVATPATACQHGNIVRTEEAFNYTKTTTAIPSTAAALTKPAENLCPRYDKFGFALAGALLVDLKIIEESVNRILWLSTKYGGQVEVGGWWRPKSCKPRFKVAIMVPFRNRELQLKMFIYHITPILQRQMLEYRIFVIEQVGKTMFNKGAIYNIGFNETLQIGDFDCYIFHDIDLLAENDRNYYGCPESPKHMSPAVDTLKYQLSYNGLFGGVEVFKKQHFDGINGFSNRFWGWGGEDDDLYTRAVHKGLSIVRPPMNIGRYIMNQRGHFRSDPRNEENVRMYHDVKSRSARIDIDGLHQISELSFEKTIKEDLLFTRISVDLHRNITLKEYTTATPTKKLSKKSRKKSFRVKKRVKRRIKTKVGHH